LQVGHLLATYCSQSSISAEIMCTATGCVCIGGQNTGQICSTTNQASKTSFADLEHLLEAKSANQLATV
jgi:hypothetical protein